MYISEVSQVIHLLAVTLQQLGLETFTTPITNALGDFATTVAQAAPKIVAAVVLLAIGLIVGRAIGWVVKKVAQ